MAMSRSSIADHVLGLGPRPRGGESGGGPVGGPSLLCGARLFPRVIDVGRAGDDRRRSPSVGLYPGTILIVQLPSGITCTS